MPKGNIKRSDISKGILASIKAVELVVQAIAIGSITVELPFNVAPAYLRYAPHFAIGLGRDEAESVPYNIRNVSEIIGSTHKYPHFKNEQASRWMRMAFEFLEGLEAGYVDETWITDIQQERYSMQSLRKALRAAKTAHEIMSRVKRPAKKSALRFKVAA